ncbi:MAG: hypothetical protein V1735_07100 [Nanoarchaeota archaeon]
MVATLAEVLTDIFITHLDQTLAQIAITVLLFFYGGKLVRWFVRNIRGKAPQKFIIFCILVIFGVSFVLVSLVRLVSSIAEPVFKWTVIACLLLWSFFLFDQELMGKRK